MRKKCVFIFIFSLCIIGQVKSQSVKDLYYVGGSNTGSCGNIMLPALLVFVSDTLHQTKKTTYVVAVICPEAYGDDFFKKNGKYKLHLESRNKKVKQCFPSYLYEQFIKMPNHYYSENIKKAECY